MQKVKYVLKHCHVESAVITKRGLLEVNKSDFYVALNKLIDLNYTFNYRNDKDFKSIVVFTQGNLEFTEVWKIFKLCEVK